MRSRSYVGIIATVVGVVLLVSLGPTLIRFDYGAFGTRASWQLPERILQELALEPGVVVADVGAGDGYFTFRLADAVSEAGKVFAVEIDAGILSNLRSTSLQRGVTNVETVLATAVDPGLPDNTVDLAFVCNVYHHIEARREYFEALRQDLRPGGRVAIVEMTERAHLRWLGPSGHWTSVETLQQEMAEFGYRLIRQYDFLPLQSFLVFEVVGSAAN